MKLGSALKFPVSKPSIEVAEVRVHGLCLSLVLGCDTSVCLSVVPQQFDVISYNVPLSAQENSFDLAGGVTD